MECPDCGGSGYGPVGETRNDDCSVCKGTGNLCDVCGESCESGEDKCAACKHKRCKHFGALSVNHKDVMTAGKDVSTWQCQKCRWIGYAEQVADKSKCPNCGEKGAQIRGGMEVR